MSCHFNLMIMHKVKPSERTVDKPKLCNRYAFWENFHYIKWKMSFWGIQQTACSQNSPTKLVAWSYCAQSTVPPLIFVLP